MFYAKNGEIGLKTAREVVPDLIFLDIMMPKKDGIEVLEELKSDSGLKHIPVVMLSNLSGSNQAEEALKKGAVEYIIKNNFSPLNMVEKVNEMLVESGKNKSEHER